MKLLVLLLFVLCFSCNRGTGNSQIWFEKEILDIGSIKMGEAYKGKVLVKNVGTDPLIIKKIGSDCQCTVSEVTDGEILPGDSTYIEFSVKPSVTGTIQQKIIVDSNSKEESRALLLVRAKVYLAKE